MKNKILIIFSILLIFLIIFFGFFSITEYKPNEIEQLNYSHTNNSVKIGDSLSLISYNIGYGGLNENESFFMDGGTGVNPKSPEVVKNNLKKISEIIKKENTNITFIQEVDIDSDRSFNINQTKYFEDKLSLNGTFAHNFKVNYIPYPIPPIGKVESGLSTYTDLDINSAERYSLPSSFTWPLSLFNLKRCLLIEHIPIKNSDKELVLINLHLDAYDNGEGKIAQMKVLNKILNEEYKKGNYIIAGGDFNQELKNNPKGTDLGQHLLINKSAIPQGYKVVTGENYNTCRLLRTTLNETNITFTLDGFIVSNNIQINDVKTINTHFKYSDHNPVKLYFTLK